MDQITKLLQLLESGKIDSKQFDSVVGIIKKDQYLKDKQMGKNPQSIRPIKSKSRIAKKADPKVFQQLDKKRNNDLQKIEWSDKINKQKQMIKKMELEMKHARDNEKIQKKKAALIQPLNNLHIQSRVELFDKSQGDDAVPEWITDYTPMQSTNTILSPEERDQLEKTIREKYEGYEYDVGDIELATKIDILSNTGFIEVKNKHKALAYKILDDINQDKEKQYDDPLCVPRYILKSVCHIDGFKKLTLNQIREQFKKINVNIENGVSVEELKLWIIQYYPKTIAMYAIDPLMNKFDSYTNSKTVLVTLAFVINNAHVYPIFDNVQKSIIAHTKNKSVQLKEICWDVDTNNYQTVKYYHRSNNDLDYGVEAIGSNEEYDKLIQGKGNKYDVALIENSLEEVMKDVINETGYLITGMKIQNGEILAFQHPVNEQIIELAIDLDKRKYICDKLYGIFGYECFKWKNQSFATLVNSLFEIKNGKLEQSTHIKEDQIIYDTYHTSPLIGTLMDIPYDSNSCFGFDCKKSYPNAMINMVDDYPVFSICDQFKKYENDEIVIGEYVIDDITIESLGGIHIKKQVVGYNFVKYLLENKFITIDKILFVKKASYNVKKEIYATFIKELKEMFGEDSIEYKSLAHCFIGNLGKRYNSSDCGFVSDDWATVSASYHEYSKLGEWNVKTVGGLHFVRVKQRHRLLSENSQIFRQVLSQGMIQLLELIKLVYCHKKSILVGYNTDSVFIRSPKINSFPKDHPFYRNEDWKPKKYTPIEKEIKPDIKIAEFKLWTKCTKDLENKSFCCIGPGGAGKSTELVKNFEQGATIVLTFSNKAADNIRKKGIKEVYTFDSYFNQHDDISQNITKILIDEYSMLPTKWIRILYNLKLNQPNIIIQFYGDPNQCKQVCSYKRYFDYGEKYVFRYLCDFNLVIKEYIEGTSRYDKELYEVLTYLIETGKLHEKLKNRPIDENLETNIVVRNKKRFEINNKFAKEWSAGMKIISKDNDKNNNVFNSQIFYIKEIINEKYFTISETLDGDVMVDKEGNDIKFCRSKFDPAYGVTIYKYQGDTISENYNIHQCKIMDRNELYTALSRARSINQIHIEWTNKKFYFAHEPNYSTNIDLMTPKTGYIYLMTNEKNKLWYVGQTTTSIEQRFSEHKKDPKDSMHECDGDWTVKELSKVIYVNDSTLKFVEKRYIYSYHQMGDYKIINKQNLPKIAKINKIKISTGNIDDNIKKRLSFEEYGNILKFKKKINGKVEEKKIQFGARKSRDQAVKEMNTYLEGLKLSFE
jgi:hypothetical protein